MVKINGLEVLYKYKMFRLNDIWTASSKGRKFHPHVFIKDPEIAKLLKEIPESITFKKGRYGGVYGSQGVAMAYSEWLSYEVLKDFCKQTSKPEAFRSKSTEIPSSKEPLVPVTRLCELHLEQFYWDKKSPQQMNLILAALGYQVEGEPFNTGYHTVKQWKLTDAGAKFGAMFTTLSGQKYIRWSTTILEKIKRG